VHSGAQRLGLLVDRLLGEHQTVIKPLAGIFKHLPSLAGSTILGSGEVALVLDMPGLFGSAVRSARASFQPVARGSFQPVARATPPQEVVS
jgi:two-component system, chemotaxis family, sensor kinase CheA